MHPARQAEGKVLADLDSEIRNCVEKETAGSATAVQAAVYCVCAVERSVLEPTVVQVAIPSKAEIQATKNIAAMLESACAVCQGEKDSK